ncbi:endo-1,4-beta-xylanase, partial [Herbivorax sp. ANBcel31]|uniref:endo-1,4-beta-xylanase n=1 Tax=Herbivorax sp. ANBcel31 TaxID=3069754 RepID=UPI0027B6D062
KISTESEEEDQDLFYDFEDGTTQGWSPRGDVTVEAVDEEAYAGNYSLKTTGRADNWQGPSLNLINLLEKDTEHHVCAYLKVVEMPEGLEDPLTFTVSVEELPTDSENGDKSWEEVASVEIADTEWVQISGVYTFEEDMDEQTLYVESNHEEVGFYIDNVSIGKDQTGIIADFEDSIGDWDIRDSDGGSIELTEDDNHTTGGSQSLSATVSTQYNGPILDVMGKMHRGHRYQLSAWVKMAPEQTPTSLRISVQSGSATFTNVSEDVTATDEEWVKLSGEFTLGVTPSVLNAYVETPEVPDDDVTFYMDDFVISYIGPVGASKPIQTDLTPIKDIYQDYFLIGNIVSSVDLQGNRLELLKHHNDIVTAENAMKPDYVYDTNREFDFDAQNELVAGVEEAGLDLFGHALVWHQQMPIWLSTDEEGEPLEREEALESLRTHITTVVENFEDKVIGWDVVNEAIRDGLSDTATPDNWEWALRESPWYNAIGPDYVEQSFRIAKEVLEENGWSDVKLYYNDYNEDNQQKAAAMYSMVKDINDRYAAENDGELLIDGIGMQSHYNINTNVENVRLSLERFIELGVEVSITELDVVAGSDSVLSEDEAIAQGYLYAELFNLYKEHAEHIERVTVWGLDDGASWRSDRNPVLFDADLQAKPAYYAVIDPDAFIEENPLQIIESKKEKAVYGTPTIDGNVDDIWSEAPEINVNQYQTAWEGATGVARALWDEDNLYVLVQVNANVLDNSSENPWEQDSVEIFIDQNNYKSTFYQEDNHGQYRVSFENEASFNPASIAEGFESATSISGTNYTVEVKIPLTAISPAKDMDIGFDVQINDAENGSRVSAAAWNDLTGTGYMDPSVFGVLTLVDEIGSTGGGTKAPSRPDSTGDTDDTDDEDDEDKDDDADSVDDTDELEETAVVVESTVDDEGKAIANVSEEAFEEALSNAKDGKLKVKVKGAEDKNDVSVKLIAEQVRDSSETGVKEIEINTGIASVELPTSLFSESKDDEEIELNVSRADTASLSEEVNRRVGSNNVYRFGLSVGEQKISQFGENQRVRVSFDYTLEAGLNPGQVVVYYITEDEEFEVVKNGHYKNGKAQFKAKHFSQYTAIPVEVTLADLDDTSWAKNGIIALAARDIVKGVSEDSFEPLKNVTRAEFIQMLVNTFGLESEGQSGNPFSDVEAGAWYEEAVITAYELGVVKGRTDGSFGVNDEISRQDMAVMTYNTLKSVGITLNLTEETVKFKDASAISEYAKESVEAMQQAGVISGMATGEFAPVANANRAQAAVILYQLIDEL